MASHDEQLATPSERILLFWVAVLGAVASKLVEHQEWFAVPFQRLAQNMEILCWGVFVSVQAGFCCWTI